MGKYQSSHRMKDFSDFVEEAIYNIGDERLGAYIAETAEGLAVIWPKISSKQFGWESAVELIVAGLTKIRPALEAERARKRVPPSWVLRKHNGHWYWCPPEA